MDQVVENSRLRSFFNNELFSDVTLDIGVGDQEIIKAHKCVLAEKSSYFFDLFDKNKRENTFKISDQEPYVIREIIHHMYGRVITLEPSNVSENFKYFIAAGQLKYDAIVEHCQNVVYQNVNVDNVLEVLFVVESYIYFDDLRNSCFDIIEGNFPLLTKQEKWKSFLETCQEVLKCWLLRFNTVVSEMNRSFAIIVTLPVPKIVVKPFIKMLITQKFSDVVLMSKDGETIKAHKIILSNGSKVFQEIFTSDTFETQGNRIIFDEMDFKTLSQLVKFIYCGKVDAGVEDVALDLLFAAQKYSIPDLKELCEYLIFKNINAENVFEILAATHNFDFINQILKKKCKEYIRLSFRTIISRSEWKDFAKKNPEFFTELIEDFTNFKKRFSIWWY